MADPCSCIAIPEELQKYQNKPSDTGGTTEPRMIANFGVKVVKNNAGQVDYVEHYTNDRDLLKRIFYDGSLLAHIMFYRNNKLYEQEDFFDGKVTRKLRFDSSGDTVATINYVYNRNERIVSIQKIINRESYKVEYGYDELDRINRRKLFINNTPINEQHYRYDILDRIVLYRDYNQTINVKEVGAQKVLINYVIQDRIGNEISVYNKFENDRYIKTELTLNGHKAFVNDIRYVDNPMLRRPYTREDDLDFMMTNLCRQEDVPTKRQEQNTVTNFRVDNCVQRPILPISIRKSQLLCSKTGF